MGLTEQEKKVLRHVYLEDGGYVRGVAKSAGLPPITVSRILNRMLNKGMVKLTRNGNVKNFHLNYSNFNTIGVVMLIEQERLGELSRLKPMIFSLLDEMGNLAEMIAIYGSSIRSGSFNDVDILFVGENKDGIIKTCRKVGQLSGLDISPHVLSFAEFSRMVKSGEAFVKNNIEKPKNRVFVLGLDMFLKIIKR